MPADVMVASPPAGSAATLRTEFPFVLPRGYVDDHGEVHREGVMRLATARDEILPQRDPRVRDNEAYLTVLLLSRVITRLGGLGQVHPGVIEGMFASDLAFLQDLYRRVNQEGTSQAAVTCPACSHEFTVEIGGGHPGES
ncbi:MAG: secreted protein [Chloroflexi bacterium]|nr:secreted protein [Chloroflexota bacterium]